MCTKKMIVLLLLVSLGVCAAAQEKYALIIGNGTYAKLPRLNNPMNDANDIAEALARLGFRVDKLLNASMSQIEIAAARLKSLLASSQGSYGFLYYAGHGVQSAGENYLIPVDADIVNESFLRSKAVSIQALLDELNSAGNALNVVVLDACRGSPFPWDNSGNPGLSAPARQPADSIIAFAAGAGSVAADGSGGNSLFTGQLLSHLSTPGIDIKEVFDRAGQDVARVSGGNQVPVVYSQYSGGAYFAGLPPSGTPAPAQARAAAQAVPRPATQTTQGPVSITYTRKLPEMKHPGMVYSAAWSPDGRYIASGSGNGTIKLWDAATGEEIRTLSGHSKQVNTVAWNPDGNLASGSGDNTIKIWDVHTGTEIRSFTGHSGFGGVGGIAYSPDGKYIASCSLDKTVKVWDAAAGTEIRSFAENSFVSSVAYSPDGKYIASGSHDNTIKVWDTVTGRQVRTIAGHSRQINSVAYSPDGKYIVSGSNDNTIKVWDAASGRQIRTITGHSKAVNSVAYSPDGKYIVSGSADETTKLWDAATGRQIRSFARPSNKPVHSVAWSPDGKYIVDGFSESAAPRDGGVRIWDATTGGQK